MQRGVQRRAAHGGTQVAARAADGRKILDGDAQLLGEERDQARVRLMGGKRANRLARDAAAMLHFINYLFHAIDRRT